MFFVQDFRCKRLRDQQIPYWHEQLYLQKVQNAGASGLHLNIPINRYGHCEFTIPELVAAFAILVNEATGEPLRQEALEQLLPRTDARTDFERLVREFGK